MTSTIMKINIHPPARDEPVFGNLPYAAMFVCDGMLYIKVRHTGIDCNAINVQTKIPAIFLLDTPVLEVESIDVRTKS